MTIKQLESTGEILLGIFACSAGGVIVDALQAAIPAWLAGSPPNWPSLEHMLVTAAFTGLAAVVGWIKMKSPWAPVLNPPTAPKTALAPQQLAVPKHPGPPK